MEVATIGQYRVTGVIGRGGMGAVYSAEHSLLGRPAAIKILLPELSQKQDIVMRFFNEARAATAIRHPGIVEIYDFGWTPDGAAYIVMEHLEGETLSRRAARARFSWQSALAIARQIAGALSAAHAKGIVHRDLKPENIFLVRDPEVPGGERIKLLDFGIAKLAGETAPTVHVTRTGAVMGTPTYMAPEQCRGVPIDQRADLYSLGCILFELCAGRPPFTGEGAGDVLAAHIHVPAPTFGGSGVKAPAPVEHLLQRLLVKSPDRRIQSADELIREIDAVTAERRVATASPAPAGRARSIAETTPSTTTLSGAATTSQQMTVVAARRQIVKIAGVSATAAVLTIAIVALVMRPGRDATPASAPAISHSVAAESPATVEPKPPAPPPPAVESQPPAPPPPAAESQPPAPPPPSAESQPPAPSPRAAESHPPAPSPPAVDSKPAESARAAVDTKPAESARSAADTKPAPSQPRPVAVEPKPAASPPPRPREAAPRPTIDVVVESIPTGAQIMLGGVVLGKTPYRGAIEKRAGDVVFVLRLAGYADRTVTVLGNQPISERIRLVKPRDQGVNPFLKPGGP